MVLQSETEISVNILKNDKKIIENGFPFVEISEIAELESWRKEVYRPIYHIHKWWAQRLGSIFRSIILAGALPDGLPLLEKFYQKNDLNGLIVFDPFMGSGTTIGEAIKLGCTAIGRDINPVAYNAVRASFSRITKSDVLVIFNNLDATVGKKIRSLYQLDDGSQVLYYFWVKWIDCPKCGERIDLFKNYIFSKNAYPLKTPEAQCYCPRCGEVFSTLYNIDKTICPTCNFTFNPQKGSFEKTKSKCPNCEYSFKLLDAVRKKNRPLEHRLYAKMVLHPTGDKKYYKITKKDVDAYLATDKLLIKETPFIDNVVIKPGYNTNQVLNYCYTSWNQFFNSRQLLALSWLAREIKKIENPDLRFVFSILFSGTLEFNNVFCSFKGEGTGAVRHMFSNHILKPECQPLEANVWGIPKSSGSFSTLFERRLLRAIDYREEPFEVEINRKNGKNVGIKHFGISDPILNNLHLINKSEEIAPKSIYLTCGDSAYTDLKNKSVDLVVTDPPFFNNVHYSELADFFYVWQRPLLEQITMKNSTRDEHEVQDNDSDRFTEKLTAVFKECNRVLKDDGLLIFTYHHSKEEGWVSIAKAVTISGFNFVAVQPVKAEMSVAVPKKQAKNPINLDIIIVCRKIDNKSQKIESSEAFDNAVYKANEQIKKFKLTKRELSDNDTYIIMFSNLLVSLSAGRDNKELIQDLEQLCKKYQKSSLF